MLTWISYYRSFNFVPHNIMDAKLSISDYMECSTTMSEACLTSLIFKKGTSME